MFEGVYTALITPFTSSGVDEEGLRLLITRQLQAGVHGLVILGTTGEAPTLSEKEQQAVITITVDAVKGAIPVIVGTGSNCTTKAIENTKRAQTLGADGALIVTPYYNKPSNEGLFLHFKAIVEASSIPIIVYNIQGRTAKNIDLATMRRIASLPRIVGLKEASGHIDQMIDMVHALASHGRKFRIFSGDDALTLPLLSLGGHGVVSVASNLVPQKMVALYEAVQKGYMIQARQLHNALLPLFRALFVDTNPMPIKEALHLAGLPAGPCRLPLCALTASCKTTVQTALKNVDLELCPLQTH